MHSSRGGPEPLDGKVLEILFFGPSEKYTSTPPIPFVSENVDVKRTAGGETRKRIVFTASPDSHIEQIAEDRTPWIPLKHQQQSPRLALVFNDFVTQFRLACHRFSSIIFASTPGPDKTDDISMAVYAVKQTVIYCAVHGMAYSYATSLYAYKNYQRQYLDKCIDILITGFPASKVELISLATSEFRREQNRVNPIDDLLIELVKRQKNTLPVNYRASCWFHSACVFMMPSSRSAFDFLQRSELEKKYISGAFEESHQARIILDSITASRMQHKPMHHATLPLTEILIKFLYEALRIICERRSTPMLNLIEIFSNLYTQGSENYGIVQLERSIDDATDTAWNLVSPFTFPWKLAPTKTSSNVFIDSQSYSNRGSFIRCIDEFLLASMGPTPQIRHYVKDYTPTSQLSISSARSPGIQRDGLELTLKGRETMDDPYISLRAWENHRVLMHIANAGYPPRLCYSLERSPNSSPNKPDNKNRFSRIVSEYGTLRISDSIVYTLASCLFYVPGHYHMRFRDPKTSDWYNYNDLNPKIEKLPYISMDSKDDLECNVIMLVRLSPGVRFNYNLLLPPLNPIEEEPAPKTSVAIIRYGGIDSNSAARCRYVLATNGLSPTHYFDRNYVEGGVFGEETPYEAISSEMNQLQLDKFIRMPDTPFNILCINSVKSVSSIFKTIATITTVRNKLAVIYYGLIPPGTNEELKALSSHVSVMVIPPLARDVCALTQQFCSAISHHYKNISDFKSFAKHLWTVYSNTTIPHQYFSPKNFTIPTDPSPARHRWIPYVENGHYLLICHADRTSYLKSKGSQTRKIFERETVEVWGRDVITSIDPLDIPYKSRWFIYDSESSCYLNLDEIEKVVALLENADCTVTRIAVD